MHIIFLHEAEQERDGKGKQQKAASKGETEPFDGFSLFDHQFFGRDGFFSGGGLFGLGGSALRQQKFGVFIDIVAFHNFQAFAAKNKITVMFPAALGTIHAHSPPYT
jgi:hypothetical protein